ncbi:MAG: DAK2 domain-containing protein [Oscillospiraceae bacterium]|nr:DAK2 domain-containing protein [Oscillospiraceae bacterium]
MRQTIDGAAFRRMAISASASIDNHKQKINDLNVFPVPDGDTGTNMSMTFQNAVQDLRKAEDPTLTKAADIVASALLRGARGNSGVILSLLFRGFAKSLKGKTEADGTDLALALTEGVEAAYKAVMKPAEGTILTVSRVSAAAGVEAAKADPGAEAVLEQIILSAQDALEKTTHQNPVLKKAGVVDAGGMGYIVILQGMLASLQGNDVIPAEPSDSVREAADFSDFDTEEITFPYCTEFIVSRETDLDPEDLRAFLAQIGDSLVLVDDEEIIKVHVHTDHPGKAMEEALRYGSFVTVKVENMRLQHTEKILSSKDAETISEPTKPAGVVAVCAGTGIAGVFHDLGVDRIVEGGQTMNPSTQDILSEINRVPAETVYVLPNNKNIIMAAEQAVPLTKKNVVVIPTKTIPQGVSAMLNFDPDGEVESNKAAMNGCLDSVTTMQLTYAARDSDYDGFQIHAGDYMALVGSSLFATDTQMKNLVERLAEHTASLEKEFITIYYGQDVSEQAAQEAESIFAETCPGAEINLINGGQPIYYFLISAE